MEGRFKPRCGSLHKMGEPLFVFCPLTAQLLLPLSGLGFCVLMTTESLWLK